MVERVKDIASHLGARAPIRVCVTGAAGQIGYALVFKIARGEMFGPTQPVLLHLLEVPGALSVLGGVVMELEDCALPLLAGVVATADNGEGFCGVDYAVLVGAMPRKAGMERADLLKANVGIFKAQGQALEKWASPSCKVLVVGNPANTNALVCAHFAPSLPRANFSALTRLDHNRALALAARRLALSVADVQGVVVWGNHSGTQFADVAHAQAAGRPVLAADPDYFRGEFVAAVQKRGAAVIAARTMSSAASAAQAIVDHVRDWHLGTDGRVVSMAVPSGAYGIPEGVIFSYPVTVDRQGKVHIVEGLPIDDYARKMLETTHAELLEEKNASLAFLA